MAVSFFHIPGGFRSVIHFARAAAPMVVPLSGSCPTAAGSHVETWVAHHSCPKATLRVEPLPGAAHAASSVRLLHTARAAGVHTIWFVGDSMHTPEAYVASCLAFREAEQMGERVLWTPKQPCKTRTDIPG